MPKVLALHNNGQQGEHWFTASEYRDRQIDDVQKADPRGGKTHQPPTSVPSPFAQMDLVLTAFKNIIKDGSLGKISPIDFKLVSDMLDVAEIFFRYNMLKNQPNISLELVIWNQEKDLGKLKDAANSRHQRLGSALELYFSQDSDTYNFDMMEEICILKYNHKVIGATSPATLFFASPNDLSFVQLTMPSGDKLFDTQYAHLYEREEAFQKWFYGLQYSIPNFNGRFREIKRYIDICLELLEKKNRVLFNEIHKLEQNYYSPDTPTLENLEVTGDNRRVMLLKEVPLLCLCQERLGDTVDSDFTINTDKNITPKPLVLKPGHDGRGRDGSSLIYYKHKYDASAVNVPYFDNRPLEERFLPARDGVKFPYLTTSDFLELYLMEVPYTINANYYYTVEVANKKDARSYLLPIKPLFFQYFDAKDIPDLLSMEAVSGGFIRVKLKIPIQKGEFVVYERLYGKPNNANTAAPDETQKEGIILLHLMGLAVYPFVHIPENIAAPDYRVMLVDRDTGSLVKRQYKLDFHTIETTEPLQGDIYDRERINKDHHNNATNTTKIFVVKKNFDYIRVSTDKAKGLIVPNFKPLVPGTSQFSFAVDFGTTNTHIEYKIGDNQSSRALDIKADDLQLATFHDPVAVEKDTSLVGTSATEVVDLFKSVFPTYLGHTSEFKFPQRTVLMGKSGMEKGEIEASFTLADFNIPFSYGRYSITKQDFNAVLETNLKWSQNSKSVKYIDMFFENLMFIMRSKVLMNGGNLRDTRLVVFYPTSMEEYRRIALTKRWQAAFDKYFFKDGKSIRPVEIMHEGLAPFYYYAKETTITAAVKPAVCIDIGGGTTDVLVFKQDLSSVATPVLHTSMRFAGNAIFGNGLNSHSDRSRNGFVKRYEGRMKELVFNRGLNNLEATFEQIVNEMPPSDIIDFFFSLSDNKDLKGKNISTSFSKILTDDEDIRIVFVLFYTALIYHVAQVMRAKNLEIPSCVMFSGNGSKVLDLIGGTDAELANLAKHIFAHVYGTTYDQANSLEVQREELEPKALTCKGGLSVSSQHWENIKSINADDLKVVLLGLPIDAKQPYNVMQGDDKIEYSTLTPSDFEGVANSVLAFADFLVNGLNKAYPLQNKLGIQSKYLMKCVDLLKSNTLELVYKGKQIRLEASDESGPNKVEETFFFYPIIDALYKLANVIDMTESE